MVNLEVIVNVLIAMFVYNIIIKAISAVLIKQIFDTKAMQDATKEVKKTFAEKLAEKENERKS
jgi:hypothetical protein